MIVLGLVIFLGLIHYISSKFSERLEKYHITLLSFSAGIFVTILFLDFFPRIINVENSFLLVLLGFVLFHVAEKYVYQHKRKTEMSKTIGIMDVVGFFIDGFLDGMILVLSFKISPQLGYILFPPLLLHRLSSAIPMTHIIEKMKNKLIEPLLSLSVVLGGLFAFVLNIKIGIANMVFAFLVGTLTYIIIRDMLPQGKAGNPLMFLIGVFLAGIFYILI